MYRTNDDTVTVHTAERCANYDTWTAALHQDDLVHEDHAQHVAMIEVTCECGATYVTTTSKFRFAWETDTSALPGEGFRQGDREGHTFEPGTMTPAQREWAQGSRDGKHRAADIVRESIRELSPIQAEAMLATLTRRYNRMMREFKIEEFHVNSCTEWDCEECKNIITGKPATAAVGKIRDAIRQLRNVVLYGKDAIAPVRELRIDELSDEQLIADAKDAARQAWREGYRLGKIG